MNHNGLARRMAINPYFLGSHFHHLNFEEDLDLGVYIPEQLHKNTLHNSDTGNGIENINKLAYDWMVQHYELKTVGDVTTPTYDDFMDMSDIILEKLDNACTRCVSGRSYTTTDHKFHIQTEVTQEEATALIKAKEDTGLNWTNFILFKSGIVNKEDIITNKKGKDSNNAQDSLKLFLSFSYSDGDKLRTAKKKSGVDSWHDYFLSLINYNVQDEEEPPYISDSKRSATLKEMKLQKKIIDNGVKDFKCLKCEHEKIGRCKLLRSSVLDLVCNGINFDGCISFKLKSKRSFEERETLLNLIKYIQ